MVQIFECKNNTDLQEKYKESLEIARNRISHYPLLNQILNNFVDYEDYSRANSRNVILNISMPRWRKGYWTEYEYSLALLENLEQALNNLKGKMTATEFKELVSRLSASYLFTSNSALTEVLTAYEIGHKIGFQNIDFQHKLSSRKKPDIFLKINNKNVCLELTLLNSRFSEVKIFDILTGLAKYIISKSTKKNYLISIYFDTSHLILDENKHIDEEKSKLFLFNAIDRLFVEQLIGWTGMIEFSKLDITNNKVYLHDVLYDTRPIFDNSTIRLVNELKRNEIIADWSKKVLLTDFSNSPFDKIAFFVTTNDNECVEIQTRDINTNDPAIQDSELFATSTKIKSAFISQLKKKIEEKVKEKQYEIGYPAIIAIYANEWRFDFENDYDEFIEVRDAIQKQLKQYPQLSGVIIFSSNLYNGKYIENIYADPDIQISKVLLEQSGVIKSIAEPLLTKDKAVTLSNLSDEQKRNTIKEVLEIEKRLVLEDDKRALLENIYDFLQVKVIDDNLLNDLENVIKKYCVYNEELDDGISYRNDTIMDSSIILVHTIPIKALAVGCLVRLISHRPTEENIHLAESLSNHQNSYVREHVSRDLQYLCEGNSSLAYSIATKFLSDNKYVRWYLQAYLNYLSVKYAEKCFEFCKKILDMYGKKELPEDEAVLLTGAVEVSAYLALLHNKDYFYPLLEDLVDNSQYNYYVKKRLAFILRNDNLLLNNKLSEKIIGYYTRLMDSDAKQVRSDASFFLLYKLIEKNISFYPKILPFLERAISEEYTEDSLGRAQIIYYLDKFCLEFPEKSGEYLIRLAKVNPIFLSSPFYFQHVFTIIAKLLNVTIPIEVRTELLSILEKMTQSDYVNLNLPEAAELLSKLTNK